MVRFTLFLIKFEYIPTRAFILSGSHFDRASTTVGSTPSTYDPDSDWDDLSMAPCSEDQKFTEINCSTREKFWLEMSEVRSVFPFSTSNMCGMSVSDSYQNMLKWNLNMGPDIGPYSCTPCVYKKPFWLDDRYDRFWMKNIFVRKISIYSGWRTSRQFKILLGFEHLSDSTGTC